MKNELENIRTRLSTIAEFNFTGEDWGQLNADPAAAPEFPCCLFNISKASYNDLGKDPGQTPKNRQSGSFRLKLNIADQGSENRSLSWAEHILMEKVHQALHGFSPTEKCSPLKRKNYKRLKRSNGLIVYKVIYTFEVTNV
ncbi:hypothetical protein [uncultured Chryseobacterium sp.]|uniref:hypothetical protein n=1 Tax=uncultured Chryseobacterium sp. TaxID=259322 RepID=UPI0025F56F39|nr:hypothetical protein [uncultured Chryseobacterium sp.]